MGDRELVYEEWLKHGHSFIALFALPECPHVLLAFPLRDGISRVRVVLIPEEPLPLQTLHLTADFHRSLEGGLECIPLAGQDLAPDDPHLHCDASLSALGDAHHA